jgi:hypothetical protein
MIQISLHSAIYIAIPDWMVESRAEWHAAVSLGACHQDELAERMRMTPFLLA